MPYNYVDTDLDENLLCCICRTPFDEPVTTRTCFHTFCQECILQALSVSAHCPIDRSPLSIELLGQADPIVRHLVEELTVRCPYLDAGCEYIGERHLLRSHLKLQCLYVQVPGPCSEEGCERAVARKDGLDGETFVHQEPDPESNDTQTITCECCGEDLSQVAAMKDHLASSCPEKTIPCGQAENGCTWKGRRLSLEAHTDNCPYESIKGFFSIHSTKMAQLSRDNERLRLRTDELEGIIRILRQELEWTKIALGPWYRPVYPERPPITANYTQSPNVEGAGAGPGPNRVGLLESMTQTAGNTAHPEFGVESGPTETLGSFDPFSFINRTQNEVSNIRATNNALTAPTVIDTESNPNISTHTSNSPVEFRDSHDLGGNPIPGSGSFNGLESIQSVIGSELSPETSNLQSAATMQPTAPIFDHFRVENRVGFEDGSSSQLSGWQHALPPDSMPSNPSPGIYSPNQPPISGSIHSHLASLPSVPWNRPQFTPSINRHIVAPLNLSTTVEGSLVGLRESLVTLSEALESQGRRLDLALATEGLRASEEVGSLKAIVQGLRMQVHAIMMDRNALVTGRIGGIHNTPSNIGARPQQSPGLGTAVGGEDPNKSPGLRAPEENRPSSPGGPRFAEGCYGNGGLWGFPLQQPVLPGVTIPMMGPNFLIGPPSHPSLRFNHIHQGGVAGGGVLPLGGSPMGVLSPHHLYMSPTAGSGPKL